MRRSLSSFYCRFRFHPGGENDNRAPVINLYTLVQVNFTPPPPRSAGPDQTSPFTETTPAAGLQAIKLLYRVASQRIYILFQNDLRLDSKNTSEEKWTLTF